MLPTVTRLDATNAGLLGNAREIAPGVVLPWRLMLGSFAPDDLPRVLSGDERALRARYRFAATPVRIAAPGGSLRVVLGALRGEPPAAVRFSRGARGKPAASERFERKNGVHLVPGHETA